MSDEWYYVRDGQRVGPVSASELKRLADTGAVDPSVMVSKKGLGRWVLASTISGLFDTAKRDAEYPDFSDSLLLAEGAVEITTRRLTVGPNQFELKDIHGVREKIVYQHKADGARIAMGFGLMTLFFAVWALGFSVVLLNEKKSKTDEITVILVVGFALLAAGGGLMVPASALWRRGRRPDEFGVEVSTPSGTATVLTSTDKNEIRKLVAQINSTLEKARGG